MLEARLFNSWTVTVQLLVSDMLIIDHQDSFTYNLADAFRQLGATVKVVAYRSLPLSTIDASAVILSPGPGRPGDYPQTRAVLQRLPATIPVLGVCLGMQLLNEWSGGKTVHAPSLMHGKTSAISHAGRGLFSSLTSPCKVARYHSLACQITSEDWEVCARSDDETAMAIQHRHRPWWGVQFHPESFLTPDGLIMMHNFIACVGGDR